MSLNIVMFIKLCSMSSSLFGKQSLGIRQINDILKSKLFQWNYHHIKYFLVVEVLYVLIKKIICIQVNSGNCSSIYKNWFILENSHFHETVSIVNREEIRLLYKISHLTSFVLNFVYTLMHTLYSYK